MPRDNRHLLAALDELAGAFKILAASYKRHADMGDRDLSAILLGKIAACEAALKRDEEQR